MHHRHETPQKSPDEITYPLLIDGKPTELAAIQYGSRQLVPLRAIGDYMNLLHPGTVTVAWDKDAQQAVLTTRIAERERVLRASVDDFCSMIDGEKNIIYKAAVHLPPGKMYIAPEAIEALFGITVAVSRGTT